ncbi:double-strand break repair protein AddB [Defluviimonas sp. SAOS-178_SWC]|uniref:double-strand break repair protein AddB n=1 Tax=Defluviimonas sp. SAOS-178_SWC TaxID=3121287 RepID=UPI00322181C5
MFDPSPMPRLFGLPPGANFPQDLADGLIARMAGAPPEAMARVTLYLNTARMQRSVRAAFDGHGARFLPRLRLITDLGRDPLPGLPPAVPPLRRRLDLARLVAERMRQDHDFAARSAIFDLADSLARLMDEMQGEGVALSALEAADLAEDHAAHWERSLAFIRIIARYFEADSAPDPEARQRRVVEAMTARWQDAPPSDPVIVAGSTGSRGATQMLMQAVARLPQGAIVLPGFDFDMPDRAWNSLSTGPIPSEDHPQYRFLHLCRTLEVPPGSVGRWSDVAAPAPERNRLLSLALRPAPVTDQWMTDGAGLGPLGPATEGLTLIEAPSLRSEALAIALLLRKAVEDGKRAALITPDRMLTRRVTAALDRWGIVPDDSAGLPLVQSAPGRFLRHVAALIGQALTAESLLIVLKHPLTATGADDRGNHLRFTRDLELSLRRSGPPFPTGADLRAWAEKAGGGERAVWAEWIANSLAGSADFGEQPLSAIANTHLKITSALAAGPGGQVEASELWREEAGRLALRTMAELVAEAPNGGTFRPADYTDLVTSLLSQGSVRQAAASHPLIAIQGTLEARAGGADLAILAGLNEGIWPASPAPDPWLSRQMRLKAGLLLPERQIGLSAHDFQQAAGAAEVVLSRAIRDEAAATVASRWLARMTNLLQGLPEQGGPEALRAMRARGNEWLDLTLALETPEPTGAARRPAPRPPVEARPRELPVTGIRMLIRDPYEIYARRILRLYPLDPLRAEPDARKRGTVLHRIMERFILDRPDGESQAEAARRLLALAETKLAEDIPWPAAQRIWLSRLGRIAEGFAAAEAERARLGRPVVLEEKGTVLLESSAFRLTARPDRIDLLEDGRVHIYDYKTGNPPSKKQEEAFDKQLLLEAAMAERGGFPPLGKREVAGATYIRIGGVGEERPVTIDDATLAQTWDGLQRLIESYDRRATGYPSRRAVFAARMEGDYDHLARFGEWQMGDKPEPEDVG